MRKTAQFGCFELDLPEGDLRRSGRRLHLQSQPVRLLAALVESPGRVVTREQLKVILWPNDTFVDFDRSLNTAVTKIRHTLGDSAQNPRYLETVPRLGYRFLAPVTFLEGKPAETPDLAASHSRPRRFGWLTYSMWIGTAIAIAFVAAYFVTRPQNGQANLFFPSIPITSFAGSEITPVLSPDGKRVAFSWNGDSENNFDIYVKEISSNHLIRVTNDLHSDLSPAWSPDGRSLAFLRMLSESEAQILVAKESENSPAAVVASLPAPNSYYDRDRLLTWAPNSRKLAITRPATLGGTQSLVLFDLSNGSQQRLTLPPPNNDDLSPAFSRDGSKLAFVRYCGRTAGDIHVIESSDNFRTVGPDRRVSYYDRLAATPSWTPDGKRLLFVRYDMPGVPSLWQMTWPTIRPAEPLPVSSDTSFALDISRDGDKLVYTREAINTNIWAISVISQAHTHPVNPTRWMTNSFVDYNPQFSPDGRQVAFSSTRSGRSEIWLADRDGSHARQISHTNGTVSGFPRWSPDGHSVVFHLRLKTTAALYVLDLDENRARPLPMNPRNDFSPTYSRDGNWIYFASRRTGTFEIWKISKNGGTPTRITMHGGLVPLESPDGKYLYYTKFGSWEIWRQPSAGGAEEKICSAPVGARGTGYALGRNGIFFLSPDPLGIKSQLLYLDLKSSKIHSLATIEKPLELGLALSPDERTILYSQHDRTESDLMLVENFH